MPWSKQKPIRASIALALVLGASGCGMGSDDPKWPVQQSDSGVPRTDTPPGTVAKPLVDPLPSTVCTESIAIQGSVAPGLTVFAVGGLAAAGVTKEAHPTTGRFCLDVPLQLGVANQIEVRAKDPARGISDPALVTVTQVSPCETNPPGPPPTPTESKNVAHGIVPVSNVTPSDGSLASLTDGNEATWAHLVQPSWVPAGDAKV